MRFFRVFQSRRAPQKTHLEEPGLRAWSPNAIAGSKADKQGVKTHHVFKQSDHTVLFTYSNTYMYIYIYICIYANNNIKKALYRRSGTIRMLIFVVSHKHALEELEELNGPISHVNRIRYPPWGMVMPQLIQVGWPWDDHRWWLGDGFWQVYHISWTGLRENLNR